MKKHSSIWCFLTSRTRLPVRMYRELLRVTLGVTKTLYTRQERPSQTSSNRVSGKLRTVRSRNSWFCFNKVSKRWKTLWTFVQLWSHSTNSKSFLTCSSENKAANLSDCRGGICSSLVAVKAADPVLTRIRLCRKSTSLPWLDGRLKHQSRKNSSSESCTVVGIRTLRRRVLSRFRVTKLETRSERTHTFQSCPGSRALWVEQHQILTIKPS